MIAVFFDLDGVLADFVRGALAIHGKSEFPVRAVRWGLEAQLGIDPVKFWEPLGYDFWANLPFYEDGFKLLRHTEWMLGGNNIALLTSAAGTKGCVDGKRAWVRKHLDDYGPRLFTVGGRYDKDKPYRPGEKFLFAGPDKILVDDNDDNCTKFIHAGGMAVKVPRPWNSLAHLCAGDGSFNVPLAAEAIRSAVGNAARSAA